MQLDPSSTAANTCISNHTAAAESSKKTAPPSVAVVVITIPVGKVANTSAVYIWVPSMHS